MRWSEAEGLRGNPRCLLFTGCVGASGQGREQQRGNPFGKKPPGLVEVDRGIPGGLGSNQATTSTAILPGVKSSSWAGSGSDSILGRQNWSELASTSRPERRVHSRTRLNHFLRLQGAPNPRVGPERCLFIASCGKSAESPAFLVPLLPSWDCLSVSCGGGRSTNRAVEAPQGHDRTWIGQRAISLRSHSMLCSTVPGAASHSMERTPSQPVCLSTSIHPAMFSALTP